MGSYSNLKDVVEKYVKAEDGLSKNERDSTKEASRMFRVAAILCLFEIAGCLDQMSLFQRAMVEQLERAANNGEISDDRAQAIVNAIKKAKEEAL